MNEKEYDIFVNQKIYPDAAEIFGLTLASLDKIKDKCKIVLDTNALLVPYLTGSESLNEIKKVFEKLKKQKRLIIPGQVAREFANNRPERLKDIFQQLNRKQSKLQNIKIGNYPLLEGINEYKEAIELEEKLNEKIVEYRKKIVSLIKQVKSWNWNDPVSIIYKKIFTKSTILDIQIDEEKIKEQLSYRFLHKIPPGFKDDNKPDDGIGDFLIWLTILEIAKEKHDVIFVSGEEKTDWYHRSEKKGLYPRFELVNEFKIASSGKSFHILKLSELLNLLGADDKIVREIAKEERHTNSVHHNFYEFVNRAETAIFAWILEREDLAVVPNNGFPDFIINFEGGFRSGIEIIPLSTKRNPRFYEMKIRDKFFRAYFDLRENDFEDFEFIFIADTNNYSFNELRRVIDRVQEKFKSNSTQLKTVIGYLNKNDEFIPIE